MCFLVDIKSTSDATPLKIGLETSTRSILISPNRFQKCHNITPLTLFYTYVWTFFVLMHSFWNSILCKDQGVEHKIKEFESKACRATKNTEISFRLHKYKNVDSKNVSFAKSLFLAPKFNPPLSITTIFSRVDFWRENSNIFKFLNFPSQKGINCTFRV